MLSPTRQDFSSDIVDNNLYMYGTDNANSHTPVTETNTKHYYSGFMGGRHLVGPSVYLGMDSSVPSYDVAIDRRPSWDAVAAGSAPVMSVASRPAGGLTCNVGVPFVTNCTTQSTAYQGMHSSVPGYHVATGRGPRCDSVTAGSAPFMSATSLPPGVLTNNVGAPIVTHAISNDNSQFTAMSNHLFKRDLLLNRLVNFDDNAENYLSWKLSFKNVMMELGVSATEELDLLIKYSGKGSSKSALSIKNSNPHDPARGLSLLWSRLDERFGSAELVESALKN